MTVFKNRGVMLDPARQMEHKSYYTFILPWLKEWGYNTLHLHLTDDQGCALVFPSHPELASAGAFTADEMRGFIQGARKLGVDVIPEIESLGHTAFITQHPQFQHLGSGRESAEHFNAMDPLHPGTRKILTDLFQDTASLFDSNVLHVGLDEVDFSHLPRYKGKRREDCWKAFADHAVWVHDAVRSLGKRPAMWGDHILMTREMADCFNRDVLIFDWHYWADLSPESLQFFCDQKFEVWGVPATMAWVARVLSHQANLLNTREFSANALSLRPQGVSGMMNTVWCPWRFLSGAMDWPMALAGHLFSVEKEDPDFCVDFCRSFYGFSVSDAKEMAAHFKALHMAAPTSSFQSFIATGEGKMAPFNREHVRKCDELATEFGRLAKKIFPLVQRARRNAERLNDVVLSARILERLGRFGANNRSVEGLPSGRPLLNKVSAAWNRGKVEKAASVLEDKGRSIENILTLMSKTM